MLKIVFTSLVFFFLCNLPIYSQNIDSLFNISITSNNNIEKYEANIQIVQIYRNRFQLDSAKLFAIQALELAQTFENSQFKYKPYLSLGDISYFQQRFDLSDSFYVKAIEYTNDKNELINIYNQRFGIQLEKGTVDNGLVFLKKSVY